MTREEALTVINDAIGESDNCIKMIAVELNENYEQLTRVLKYPLIIPGSRANRRYLTKVLKNLVTKGCLNETSAEEVKKILFQPLSPEEKEKKKELERAQRQTGKGPAPDLEEKKIVTEPLHEQKVVVQPLEIKKDETAVVTVPHHENKVRMNIDVTPVKRIKKVHIIITFCSICLVAILAIPATFALKSWQNSRIAWQENFRPTQYNKWVVNPRNSARWQDSDSGAGAYLVETDPDSSFGKMETQEISADVSVYRRLCVDVSAIDHDACYTIQILDKNTNRCFDVLQNIRAPGKNCVDLSRETAWDQTRKKQTFTINCWIQGEGKRALFKSITVGR